MSKDLARQCTSSSNSGTVVVGTSASTILAANSNRKYLKVTNNHTSNIVYLAYGRTASTTEYDTKLSPGGHEYFEDTIPTDAVSAIADGASTNVGVYEGV